MSAPAPADASASAKPASSTDLLTRHARDALEELSFLSPLYQHGSISLLIKVLTAVVEKPDEAKFRRLNAMKLLPRLRTKAGLKLLESLGFKHALPEVVAKNASEEEFMTMAEAPNSATMKQLRAVLERLNELLAQSDSSQQLNQAAASAAPASAAASSTLAKNPLYVPVPVSLPFPTQQPQEGDLTEDDKFVFFWHGQSGRREGE
jgi:hypothetical protein